VSDLVSTVGVVKKMCSNLSADILYSNMYFIL
jgi:hypothetical protein